jgi:hypothetical protein
VPFTGTTVSSVRFSALPRRKFVALMWTIYGGSRNVCVIKDIYRHLLCCRSFVCDLSCWPVNYAPSPKVRCLLFLSSKQPKVPVASYCDTPSGTGMTIVEAVQNIFLIVNMRVYSAASCGAGTSDPHTMQRVRLR